VQDAYPIRFYVYDEGADVSYPGLKLLGLSLALPALLASETYGLLTKALRGEPRSEYICERIRP